MTTEEIVEYLDSLIGILKPTVQFAQTACKSTSESAQFFDRYARERAKGDYKLREIAQKNVESSEAFDDISDSIQSHLDMLERLKKELMKP